MMIKIAIARREVRNEISAHKYQRTASLSRLMICKQTDKISDNGEPVAHGFVRAHVTNRES